MYAQHHGPNYAEVLTFRPPGFKRSIDIPFPERRLPVCDRCKKNYKTREVCRVRDRHKALPWTKTYICITLDRSCTDENERVLDGPFVARLINNVPYCMEEGEIDLEMPICTACKQKNYTRAYCRKKMQHRHLPWTTLYVLLSSALTNHNSVLRKGAEDISSNDGEDKKVKSQQKCTEEEDDEVLTVLSESRTFLGQVCSESCRIQWVDYDGPEHQQRIETRLRSGPFFDHNKNFNYYQNAPHPPEGDHYHHQQGFHSSQEPSQYSAWQHNHHYNTWQQFYQSNPHHHPPLPYCASINIETASSPFPHHSSSSSSGTLLDGRTTQQQPQQIDNEHSYVHNHQQLPPIMHQNSLPPPPPTNSYNSLPPPPPPLSNNHHPNHFQQQATWQQGTPHSHSQHESVRDGQKRHEVLPEKNNDYSSNQPVTPSDNSNAPCDNISSLQENMQLTTSYYDPQMDTLCHDNHQQHSSHYPWPSQPRWGWIPSSQQHQQYWELPYLSNPSSTMSKQGEEEAQKGVAGTAKKGMDGEFHFQEKQVMAAKRKLLCKDSSVSWRGEETGGTEPFSDDNNQKVSSSGESAFERFPDFKKRRIIE